MDDMRKLREQAALSQVELGRRIGISQSQVSAYEANPDNVPLGLWKKWIAACGITVEDVAREYARHQGSGLDCGTPYQVVAQRISLLCQYLQQPPPIHLDLPPDAPTPAAMIQGVRRVSEKPNLVFAGSFDCGKSRFANELLGVPLLPAKYQPHTKLMTVVRHLSDRPAWSDAPVWILRAGFDLAAWESRAQFDRCRIAEGDYSLLHEYATRKGARYSADCFIAYVFADAPVLRACTLIDLPGFGEEREYAADEKKVVPALEHMDVLVYLSQAKGFLGGTDMHMLPDFLQRLLARSPAPPNGDPLRNLVIVASHADPFISEPQIDGILTDASERLFAHLETTLPRWAQFGADIKSAAEFRDRMGTFFAESAARRVRTEALLRDILAVRQPATKLAQMDTAILAAKSTATGWYATQIDHYRALIADLDGTRVEYQHLKDHEPVREAEVRRKRMAVRDAIAGAQTAMRKGLDGEYNRLVDAEQLEQVIRKRYPDRSQAKTYAASYCMQRLRMLAEGRCDALSAPITRTIEDFLAAYDAAAKQFRPSHLAVGIPFNAKGAFVGGMAGLVVVGALGVWAAAAGNLGGFILVAQAAGWLAALGIHVGGGAAAVSAVAAIGGPVTIAIGLGVLVALGAMALFGESWERRLAKRIAEAFAERDVLGEFQRNYATYFEDTRVGFEQAADAVEKAYQEYLEKLRRLVEDADLEIPRVQKQLEDFEATKSFFGGIPWYPSPKTPA